MTIFSSTSFLTWLLIFTTHTWSLAWARGWIFNFFMPSHFTFPYNLQFFLLYAAPCWASPIWILRMSHCICDQPLNPTKDPFFSLFPWWGMNYIPQRGSRCLYFHYERCKVTFFAWTNSHHSTTYPFVFSLVGWHCVIN